MATLSNNTSNDKSMNGLVTIDANSISTDELDVDTLVVNLEATAPTVSALLNDTHVATTAWVTNHAETNYMTLSTTQTATGQKTFSNANTIINNTLTASIISAASVSLTGLMSSATATISGILTTNTITGTAVGTAVSLYDETLRTGAISLGTGTGVRNMSIGGVSTTLGLTGTVISVSGTSTSNIGNSSGSTTNIGNGSGSTTFTGSVIMSDNSTFGSSSADSIIANGTLTKPFIIGYSTTSSFSLSSVTPVTTFLGGTLQTTNTFSASATGTFRYVMSSITPYDASGGLSLSAGTYMLWIGINFEDASAFNMTDLKMGISNIGTLSSASTEAQIVAALPNLTCYFHKTDAADAAPSDSENRVLSSCFNISAATTMFPFYDANHSVTMDTVRVDVIITKIGSA